MFITRLDLDNYGPFIDKKLEIPSGNLTIIIGPNEAGKSALRAFIRMVLFGFLNRRDRQFDFYDYPPVRGGSSSGALSVTSANGKFYTIRRTEGTRGGQVIVSGDDSGGQELVDSLISGLDQDVYQNVFSISIGELQEFNTLNSGEVKERIYSAGLGVGSLNLPSILNELKRESDNLWSPRSGQIRHWFTDLTKLREELSSTQLGLAQYEDLGGREHEINEQLSESRVVLLKLHSMESRKKKMIELRGSWDKLLELERQISLLPDGEGFPYQGVSIFEQSKLKRNELQEMLSRGDEIKDEGIRKISYLGVIEAFLLYEHDIERLRNEISHYESAAKDLPNLKNSLLNEEERISEGGKAFRTNRNDPGLFEGMDIEAIQDELTVQGEKLTESNIQLKRVSDQLEGMDKAESLAKEELKEAIRDRERLQGVPNQSLEELELESESLVNLHAAVVDQTAIEQELRNLNFQLSTLSRSVHPWNTKWIPLTILLLGAIILTGSIVFGEFSGVISGFVMAGLASGLYFWTRGEDLGTEPTSFNRTLKLDQGKLAHRSEGVRVEIESLLSRLQLKELPSEREIIEHNNARQRQIRIRTRFDEISEKVKNLTHQHEQAHEILMETESLVELKNLEAQQSNDQWVLSLEKLSLDPGLTPLSAISVLGGIRSLREQERNAREIRQRISTIENYLKEIEGRLSPILIASGLPLFETTQALGALDDLQNRYAQHKKAEIDKRLLEDQIEKWESERNLRITELEGIEKKILGLLQSAGCSDEHSFLDLGSRISDRENLQLQMEELLRNQPLLINEEGTSFREELKKESSEETEAYLQEINSDIKRIQQETDQLLGDQRSVQDDRDRMERSNPSEEIQSHISQLTEEIEEAADRWAVSVIAQKMLTDAREKYQREKQGPLLESASRYFKQFTKGRYSRVESVIGEERLQIVDSFDKFKDAPSMLSRGTAEQLFLAMRFALIDEYSRNSEPMPVVLDDVMVNFDPERAQATCEGIVELSSRHQVILLTCNPETVRRIQIASEPLDKRPTVIEI